MAPKNFLREKPGIYWVLAEYESKSEPGKMYEVRTSQRDGKTYCTCRGWVMALNKTKVNGGEAECCHIKDFRSSGKATEPIVIMDFESFAAVKRGIPLNAGGKVGNDVRVRRA